MFKRIIMALKRALKRFFSNEPRTPYERIAFNAARETALTFGRTA